MCVFLFFSKSYRLCRKIAFLERCSEDDAAVTFRVDWLRVLAQAMLGFSHFGVCYIYMYIYIYIYIYIYCIYANTAHTAHTAHCLCSFPHGSFLKRFRNGLLTSNVAKSNVDKIMTTVNQCCLEGLTFYHLDPSLNKQAKKQKAKEATEERAGCDGGDEGDDTPT